MTSNQQPATSHRATSHQNDYRIITFVMLALAIAFMLIAWGAMIPLGAFAFVGFATSMLAVFCLGWIGGATKEAERRSNIPMPRYDREAIARRQRFADAVLANNQQPATSGGSNQLPGDADAAQAIADFNHQLDIYG